MRFSQASPWAFHIERAEPEKGRLCSRVREAHVGDTTREAVGLASCGRPSAGRRRFVVDDALFLRDKSGEIGSRLSEDCRQDAMALAG